MSPSDRLDLNVLADQGDFHRLGGALVENGEGDGGVRFAAEQQEASCSDIPRVLVVADPQDSVADANAGPRRRRIRHGAADDQLLGLRIGDHGHADAGELAIEGLVERRQVLGREVGGILVEFAEHSVHGPFKQLLIADRIEGAVLDRVHGAGQHVGVGVVVYPLATHDRQDRHEKQDEQIATRHSLVPRRDTRRLCFSIT